MKNKVRLLSMASLLCMSIVAAGCMTQPQREARTLYDFGMLPATHKASPLTLPTISVADVRTPQWLDSRMMFYRLAYANDQQPRPYANSRWSMTPAQLFDHRLKLRFGQAGGAVLSASDGVINVPMLRIAVDDFSQIFTGPDQSLARINVRASVVNGRTLVAHKNFIREVAAPAPDAGGGAKALADASDAAISDIMNWLAGLDLKK